MTKSFKKWKTGPPLGDDVFYYIIKEAPGASRLGLIRMPPKTFTIPQGQARYIIIGVEYHSDHMRRLEADQNLHAFWREETSDPPVGLRVSSWHVVVVFRKVKGAGGKRPYLLHTYIAENGGIFSLLENDEYVYIDGDFESEVEAELHRARIVHEAVKRYLSFDKRTLKDIHPLLRSEFAYLASPST